MERRLLSLTRDKRGDPILRAGLRWFYLDVWRDTRAGPELVVQIQAAMSVEHACHALGAWERFFPDDHVRLFGFYRREEGIYTRIADGGGVFVPAVGWRCIGARHHGASVECSPGEPSLGECF